MSVVTMQRGSDPLRGVALLSLPARKPYTFWVPAVLVMLAGFALAFANFCGVRNTSEPSLGSIAPGESTFYDSAAGGVDDASGIVPSSDVGSRLPKLCLSLAIVVVAGLLAGLSIAQLLDRPASGFRSVEEAERNLPIPVLGAVPVS